MKKVLSFIFLIMIICVFFRTNVVAQQSSYGWEPLQVISNTDRPSTFPAVVTDKEGNVHVFWSEKILGKYSSTLEYGDSILYTRWNGEAWSYPVNVMARAVSWGGLVFPSAAIDSHGVIHLIASGGGGAPLYYSRANVRDSISARSWIVPAKILENDSSEGMIVCDFQDNLHVVNAKYGINGGITYQKSEDGGDHWSNTRTIFPLDTTDRLLATHPRITVDIQGNLHVVWVLFDGSGTGTIGYYSQSLDNGQSWSPPIEFAEKASGDYSVNYPELLSSRDGLLHLVYQAGQLAFKFYRVSSDYGKTWSKPTEIVRTLIGETGYTPLVEDQQGLVHLILALRERIKPENHGLWHSVLENGVWQEPEFVTGPVTEIQYPQAALRLDNQIVVVAHLPQGEIVFTSRVLSYPAADVEKYITPTPLNTDPTTTPLASYAAIVTSTPSAWAEIVPVDLSTEKQNNRMIFLGIIIPFVVISLVMIKRKLVER